MNVTRPDRRVVTFYSFKGGVGRSMALANVAFRLADRNDLDVIVVDWDLEAPRAAPVLRHIRCGRSYPK